MPINLGIVVQEERGPDQSILRLPAARTAFVGRTLRGPVELPIPIASFADFQRVFGGLWQPSLLGYAVEQFFDNGGREALIVRVVNGARSATLTLPAGNAGRFVLRAIRPGTREFLRACVDYDNIPPSNTDEFNLTIQRVRAQGAPHVEDQEIFRNLSVAPDSPRYLPTALTESEMIRADGAVPAQRPDCTIDAASGLATGYLYSHADGDDGGPLTDYDLIGSAAERSGMFALEHADYFNFLCVPPIARDQDVGASALLVAARYCRARRALLVVDPPQGWHTADEALRGFGDFGLNSEDALMYFPRILAHDKLRGRFETFAPCGAAAGLLARADGQLAVWESVEAEEPVLRPGYRPACLVTERQRAKLAAFGVNTLQSVRTAQPSPLRPRTLAAGSAGAADWRYLSARRLSLFIVNSIERGTRWVAVAQPHTQVADLVDSQVRSFLEALRQAGTFAGRSADEAYFVICDWRVNDPAAPNPRRFQLLIGFAAARLGEFHCYRITHALTGSEVQAVTLNRLNDLRYSPAEIEWAERIANQLHI